MVQGSVECAIGDKMCAEHCEYIRQGGFRRARHTVTREKKLGCCNSMRLSSDSVQDPSETPKLDQRGHPTDTGR